MVTRPTEGLGPASRAALERAIDIFGGEGAVGLVTGPGPASRRDAELRSRQARHARYVRAKGVGVAGVVVLAAADAACADALLSPDFATLHPLCADTQRRACRLMDENQVSLNQSGAERLFDRSLAHIFAVALRLSTCSRGEALSMQGGILGLLVGCLIHPAAFRERWQQAFFSASRAGILQNSWLRLQFALVGMQVGERGPLIAWLLDEDVRQFDAADSYLFVRRDHSHELLDTLARAIRGQHLLADDGLYSANPVSTVRMMAAYVRTCLRDPAHFSNEAQALLVLSRADEVAHRTARLREGGLPSDDCARLQTELDKIDRVQAIEKRRFWQIYERATDSCVRQRLLALWERAPSASPPPGAPGRTRQDSRVLHDQR